VFDIKGNGHPLHIAWTDATSGNAFLALDRNGNGKIDSGKELFGNATQQPPSDDPNGYLALAVFDTSEYGGNGDGIIDERDAIFPYLLLWIDENHDGISQPEELHSLPELGVYSLALKYVDSPRTDEYGNQFRYKSAINPDPKDGESKDGRWDYDVFFTEVSPSSGLLPPDVNVAVLTGGGQDGAPPCAPPQVPTSATITSNVKQACSNQTWTSCDGTETKLNQYGYRRCVQYQVEDQNSNPYQYVVATHEDITVIDPGNINSNMNTGDSTTNADGIFQDEVALLSKLAIPSNACSIVKQSFTATGNGSPIRVNCIRFGGTDVTITNVTSNPATCSKPTYQCN